MPNLQNDVTVDLSRIFKALVYSEISYFFIYGLMWLKFGSGEVF